VATWKAYLSKNIKWNLRNRQRLRGVDSSGCGYDNWRCVLQNDFHKLREISWLAEDLSSQGRTGLIGWMKK
jgi:hypothetical protein